MNSIRNIKVPWLKQLLRRDISVALELFLGMSDALSVHLFDFGSKVIPLQPEKELKWIGCCKSIRYLISYIKTKVNKINMYLVDILL